MDSENSVNMVKKADRTAKNGRIFEKNGNNPANYRLPYAFEQLPHAFTPVSYGRIPAEQQGFQLVYENKTGFCKRATDFSKSAGFIPVL